MKTSKSKKENKQGRLISVDRFEWVKLKEELRLARLRIEELQNKLELETIKDIYKTKSRGKIDISYWRGLFSKGEEIEDKIKEAKNEYDRLVSETPIGKLSIRQIQDYFNSIVRNIKQ
jgi:hypothetical protein